MKSGGENEMGDMILHSSAEGPGRRCRKPRMMSVTHSTWTVSVHNIPLLVDQYPKPKSRPVVHNSQQMPTNQGKLLCHLAEAEVGKGRSGGKYCVYLAKQEKRLHTIYSTPVNILLLSICH
jgi:hypothetical protein